MKLRNKKTGQLGNFVINKDHFECVDLDYVPEYRNLAELIEEWEDYEEPEEYWSIDQFGEPINVSGLNALQLEKIRRIGILFQTEEETEKAIEKIKAWKRLKDKGFRLKHWKEAPLRPNMSCVAITGNIKVDEEVRADLDLLFSGEDD